MLSLWKAAFCIISTISIHLCCYRRYTISEIINAVIRGGFTLKQFDEHPSWKNEALPWEFTLIATKTKLD